MRTADCRGAEPSAGRRGSRSALSSRRNAFTRCLAEKMLTYALGRGVEPGGQRRGATRLSAGWPGTNTGFPHWCWASSRASRSRTEQAGQRDHETHTVESRAERSCEGLGASLALPLLDAMGDRSARAGSGPGKKPPLRMAFLYVPNGVHMPDWTPRAEGKGFDLPPILEPLEVVKDDLLVLSGLTLNPARALGDGGGDHARAMASFLTGRHPRKTGGADLRAGVSVDQVAAQRLGHLTRFPSLEIGCEGGQNGGECDHGYSCAYQSNLAWRSESTPLAKQVNPRLVFDRLFGGPTENEGAASPRPQRSAPEERPRLRRRRCQTPHAGPGGLGPSQAG